MATSNLIGAAPTTYTWGPTVSARDGTTSAAGVVVGVNPVSDKRPYKIDNLVVCANISGGLGIGANQIIGVPPNAIVLAAGVSVVKVTATSGTIALGDTVTPARYLAATAPTTLGYLAPLEPGTYQDPLVTVSGTTIDLTVATAAITDATFRVWAILCDIT